MEKVQCIFVNPKYFYRFSICDTVFCTVVTHGEIKINGLFASRFKSNIHRSIDRNIDFFVRDTLHRAIYNALPETAGRCIEGKKGVIG